MRQTSMAKRAVWIGILGAALVAIAAASALAANSSKGSKKENIDASRFEFQRIERRKGLSLRGMSNWSPNQHDDLTLPPAIKFAQENPLPRAELEFAAPHQNVDAVAHHR